MTGGKTKLTGFPSDLTLRVWSIQPKFLEILVQNSMDWLGPTGKVLKKLVHLLRWTTFPGQTGQNCDIMWNLCKVQCWSKSVLTFDHYRPHYIIFPNFHFNNDQNKEWSKTILLLILLYKKTNFYPQNGRMNYGGSSCEQTPLGCRKDVHL